MHKPTHQMPNRRSRWGSWLWYGMFNIAAHTAPQQYAYAVLWRYTVQTYIIVLGESCAIVSSAQIAPLKSYIPSMYWKGGGGGGGYFIIVSTAVKITNKIHTICHKRQSRGWPW